MLYQKKKRFAWLIIVGFFLCFAGVFLLAWKTFDAYMMLFFFFFLFFLFFFLGKAITRANGVAGAFLIPTMFLVCIGNL